MSSIDEILAGNLHYRKNEEGHWYSMTPCDPVISLFDDQDDFVKFLKDYEYNTRRAVHHLLGQLDDLEKKIKALSIKI